MIVSQTVLRSKITCLQYLEGGKILIGTLAGELLMVDFVKKQDLMMVNFENQRISQFAQLPPDFKEARKQLIYVVTDKNLYCIQREYNLGKALKMNAISSKLGQTLLSMTRTTNNLQLGFPSKVSTDSIPGASSAEYNLSEKILSSAHSSDANSEISNHYNSQKRSQHLDSTTNIGGTLGGSVEGEYHGIKASYYEY